MLWCCRGNLILDEISKTNNLFYAKTVALKMFKTLSPFWPNSNCNNFPKVVVFINKNRAVGSILKLNFKTGVHVAH